MPVTLMSPQVLNIFFINQDTNISVIVNQCRIYYHCYETAGEKAKKLINLIRKYLSVMSVLLSWHD